MNYELKTNNDSVLKQVASEVTEFDEKLSYIAGIMSAVCNENKGVGLAAPQIGASIRIILIHTGSEKFRYIVNPKIEPFRNRGTKTAKEGCLSYPGKQARAKRWKKVKVTGKNIDGTPFEKVYTGLNARVAQHEIDHLNGKCIVSV